MKKKNERRNSFFFSRRDLALIMVILCMGGLLFALSELFSQRGDEVVITVGSSDYGRYPLTDDRRVKIIRDGKRNIVEISGGQVHMYSANCPDLLCVHQGYIDSSLYSIVCLPNQVVVEVRAHE